MLSLAVAGAALMQAGWMADGAPASSARHEDRPERVGSIRDLRAFSFYTTRSGYKDSSRWYFHGLLIVCRPDGEEVYNWSPRRLRFMRFERPHLLAVDPSWACEPVAPVWWTL
jgi:hypothetical protein